MTSELQDILRADPDGEGGAAAGKLPETVPEIFLGTVNAWSASTGVKITLDGEEQAMTKRYKQMLMARPLKVGARVAVMKLSGTYVVLGEIANPRRYWSPADLATDADLATVIGRVNTILAALRDGGVIWPPQT